MARKNLLLLIAIVSICLHVYVIVSFIYLTIREVGALSEFEKFKDDDPKFEADSEADFSSTFRSNMIYIGILITWGIAKLIISIFLLLGVQRERHQYIAPWVFVAAVDLVFNILSLHSHFDIRNKVLLIPVLIVALQAAMWFVVLKYWRGLRSRSVPNKRVLQNYLPDACYTTQTHQGQTGATY